MKKVNKSALIRKLYDEGKTTKEIKEKVKCSSALIAIVLRKHIKTVKQSKIVKAVTEVKQALDAVEKKDIQADWENKKAFWKTMKNQYGDATSQVMDELVDPKPFFGEITSDLVNHPPHYRDGGIEVIDFIEAKDLNYRLGNVIKYVARAGKKHTDPVQDLEKALWYLQREINTRKEA